MSDAWKKNEMPANAKERRDLVREFVVLRERIMRAGMIRTHYRMESAQVAIGFESIGDRDGLYAYEEEQALAKHRVARRNPQEL